eukprot:11227624-Lingulodinium_polyedra.AAC.2
MASPGGAGGKRAGARLRRRGLGLGAGASSIVGSSQASFSCTAVTTWLSIRLFLSRGFQPGSSSVL